MFEITKLLVLFKEFLTVEHADVGCPSILCHLIFDELAERIRCHAPTFHHPFRIPVYGKLTLFPDGSDCLDYEVQEARVHLISEHPGREGIIYFVRVWKTDILPSFPKCRVILHVIGIFRRMITGEYVRTGYSTLVGLSALPFDIMTAGPGKRFELPHIFQRYLREVIVDIEYLTFEVPGHKTIFAY